MSQEPIPPSQTSLTEIPLSETREPQDPMGSAPPRKKRKQRQQFSCAECRRLKLKCDRQVPCANCVRRSCGHLCPERERTQGNKGSDGLLSRLETLEGVLQQHGIPVPTSEQSSSQNRSPSPAGTSLSRANPTPRPVPSSEQNLTTEVSNRSPDSPSGTGAALSQLADAAVQMDEETSPGLGSWTAPVQAPPHTHHVQFDFSTPSTKSLGSDRTLGLSGRPPSPGNHSYGTLVLSQGGRSKYLGPTAASEWLKDQECIEPLESPSASRMPSPDRQEAYSISSQDAPIQPSFPFRSHHQSIANLLARLPTIEEGSMLVDCYYRYFAWHYDVAPKATFQPIFNRAYQRPAGGSRHVVAQELALVYAILAMGALHNLEFRPNDPCGETYYSPRYGTLLSGD
ncbi:uncharacterized protein IL334_006322 [Kwoniella shivajii]|uniref:Zn(2)-C6 fungal-type domain-containing protein n=1 Tax=Kwoniella shivajii TaxID=564305 RepID=A0ABZ1D5M7_9TREE|nr:hypothetical protein IL334_006322 [Kwoniella shivajii]